MFCVAHSRMAALIFTDGEKKRRMKSGPRSIALDRRAARQPP